MTGAERGPHRRPDPSSGPAPAADPEQVLAQALRAMAGGPRGAAGSPPGAAPLSPSAARPRGEDARRWTTAQVLLLAAVVGLTLGVVAGLLSLILG
ncbi:hypothetical protein JL107_13940 [Nakamurella flavida]|uniref:Uncharacterized protein n=1 Tax=Nakamurella flavida TaxID=363630 RepID=A0A938YKB5_9ACTN|nr:hypothetical protein [Nakamurella flavida]MBM9477547.1 hypothetical protein [Nakamurella flavida]MDP9779095.1 hypothetical protein [Nakamurella flavida]